MSKRSILLACFSLAAICLTGCNPFKPGTTPKRYLLAYGVAAYPAPVNPLTYCADDAVAVGAMFATLGYSVTVRTDNNATIQQFSNDMATIGSQANEHDTVLFYFSGHGADTETMTNAAALIGETTDKRYGLVFYGASAGLPSYLIRNTIGENELAGIFPKRITKKVAILDACYSGGFVFENGSIDIVATDYNKTNIALDFQKTMADAVLKYISAQAPAGPNFIVISAAGKGEVAWDGYNNHGALTYFILKSSEYGDLNNDGYVTSLETYHFAATAIDQVWNITNDAEHCFMPRITATAADIVLFHK